MKTARLKKVVGVMSLVALSAAIAGAAEPKTQYFTNVRDVQVAKAAETNFAVVDLELWNHSRTDLGDLRLYSAEQAVPYALRLQGSAEYSVQRPVKMLNKGTTPAGTQFLLDMDGVETYDQVTLQLNQHDFNTLASVEGATAPDAKTWTTLTTSPIFDFTKQNLGSNLTIKLPTSNLRYLRVAISNKVMNHGNTIQPEHVQGGTACNSYRANAVWDDVPGQVTRDEKQNETVFHLELPKTVPIDRIRFVIPTDRVNFRRAISVETRSDEKKFTSEDQGWQPVASGDLSRVRTNANKVHESLELSTHDTHAAHWRITIRNGDDPPLPVELTAQTLERRLYFDPHAAAIVKLYYGDERLSSPVYDYDKFFNQSNTNNSVAALLGPGMHNPDYTPPPDDRPWSERNGWVLWVAMIIAVLGIGSMALRGLRKA